MSRPYDEGKPTGWLRECDDRLWPYYEAEHTHLSVCSRGIKPI